MEYKELIEKAMRGRKTLPVSKEWGVNNMTLTRYISGERLPDYDTALKLVTAAGITKEEGFEILAAEERRRQVAKLKLKQQGGFVQMSTLPLFLGISVAILSILCQMRRTRHRYPMILKFTTRSHPARHVY